MVLSRVEAGELLEQVQGTELEAAEPDFRGSCYLHRSERSAHPSSRRGTAQQASPRESGDKSHAVHGLRHPLFSFHPMRSVSLWLLGKPQGGNRYVQSFLLADLYDFMSPPEKYSTFLHSFTGSPAHPQPLAHRRGFYAKFFIDRGLRILRHHRQLVHLSAPDRGWADCTVEPGSARASRRVLGARRSSMAAHV